MKRIVSSLGSVQPQFLQSCLLTLQPPWWLSPAALLLALLVSGHLWLLALLLVSMAVSQVRPQKTWNWRILGIAVGVLLFFSITSQANPAMAQLFETVESQAQNIFGEYLDNNIIGFMFGLLRIVVWVSAVGFIFFAVYQAQRGEQWQPLLQNAFIIIAAVVIVEGLSKLFFGTA